MRTLILGAGPAGITAAEILREHDRSMKITLVSSEPSPPYAPPAMADYFQTGNEETLFWKGRDVCEKLALDFRSGVSVRSVRPEQHRAELEDGTSLPYDRLLIATGARLYAPIPGSDLRAVYNFKSLQVASRLVRRIRRKKHSQVVIVGGGFIGVEVSLLLSDLGAKVTVLEVTDRVMPHMMDEETAAIVLEAMKPRGVEVRLETRAVRFNGRAKASSVELASGEKLRADVYIAATGVKPNVEFLEGSGIDIDWGIRVDDRLRTNFPDVYAAGDVAETIDRMTGQRYVHAIFPNAVAQGEVVAYNILGYDTVYEGAERMNSLKHLGIPVMAVGSPSGDEVLHWRRDDELRKIFLTDGRIVGFRLAGDIRAAGVYRSLMLRGEDITRFGDDLLNPRFGIGQMVTPASWIA
jgi:NADPH-dependent 2,4-dienoyl-CoA reductase/sulfur reductase-like enzyme